MGWSKTSYDNVALWFLLGAVIIIPTLCIATQLKDIQRATLVVNASSSHRVPRNFFGVFFEEINHAGAGGLWAELVNNRGFEAGGRHEPSMIAPWGVIGYETNINIKTELSSCFVNNPVALRMDILCDNTTCPPGGVGVYNPGFWGMNVEQGRSYSVTFYIRSSVALDAMLSFVDLDHSTQVLAFHRITADAMTVSNWTKMVAVLQATGSSPHCRLQFTSSQNGTIWLDQVSAMPTDTYMGHGFRADLMQLVLDLNPRFLRFPGGCYVEGRWLSNAFRWKETVGPWEERPGHLGDVWNYWSDDALGYLEYLQLAEDLRAEPVWVVNIGLSTFKDAVDPTLLQPFVQEMLDSIEFARGSPTSTWGALRAKLGHPAPFKLNYVAIGNENCYWQAPFYRGHYMKFYNALKQAYPDIKAISNCDGSGGTLNHPADLYDYHKYTTAEGMLGLVHVFDKVTRHKPNGPKIAVAFVSEYAVTQPKSRVANGTFDAALAEAAFLLALENNSDVVGMVSYAPLFTNINDQTWVPDAIFFKSNQAYGTPSYWVQTFFKQSSGAYLLNTKLQTLSLRIYASAISWRDFRAKKSYITVKVVNYQNVLAAVMISLEGIDPKYIQPATQTVLTADLGAQNSFSNPQLVAPKISPLTPVVRRGKYIEVVVPPYTFAAFDLVNNQVTKKSMRYIAVNN